MKTVPPFHHSNITTYFHICYKRDNLEIPFLFWNALKMCLKLNRLCSGQGQALSSVALKSNCKVKRPTLPVFKHIRNFIPVLLICKFHEDQIHVGQAMLRSRSRHSRAGCGNEKYELARFWILCLSQLSASLIYVQ